MLWNFSLRYGLSLWRSTDHYLILIGYLLPNIILQAVRCVSLWKPVCGTDYRFVITKDIENILTMGKDRVYFATYTYIIFSIKDAITRYNLIYVFAVQQF